MKKIALLTFIAVFAIAGCKKKPEPTTPPSPPKPPVDIYESFKTDATPRWESGTTVQNNENNFDYVFVTDDEGALFSSAKYKTGRMSIDGGDYEIIEFSGTPAVGKPTEPTIRKPSGSTALNTLQIVKIESGKLWIVFKETASSAERRIVQ